MAMAALFSAPVLKSAPCASRSIVRSGDVSSLNSARVLRSMGFPSKRAVSLSLKSRASSTSHNDVEPEDAPALEMMSATNKPMDNSGMLASHSALAAAFLGLLADPESALAVKGEFGILEGRTAALVHPALMFFLFGASVYAGYLGWQWRSIRTMQEEINALKATIPAGAQEGAVSSPVQAKIEELTASRKELLKGGFRDRHFNVGSLLLGLGVTTSIAGCINTWTRTGKLFPGPHLFAGAGITVLWALSAALVPAMQKGDQNARNMHIALNSINVLLFLWQIPTGLEIVGKVFEFTSWP